MNKLKRQSVPTVLSSHAYLKKYYGNAIINSNSNSNSHSNRTRYDIFTFVSLLKACSQKKAIWEGKSLHSQILKLGLLEDHHHPYLASTLISMYAMFDMLFLAFSVLENLPFRCTVSWNALISGYSQQGRFYEALICFDLMQIEGLSPNVVTFICILKVCGSIGELDKGKEIHDHVFNRGLIDKDVVLGTSLVCMYAKCGELSRAKEVLEMLPIRDVVAWSALIAGYAQQGQGQGQEALSSFEKMKSEGISPNEITFLCTLKACASIRDIEKGEDIHFEMVTKGFLEKDIMLGSALVDMYAKCGAFFEAQKVLRMLPMQNEVAWSALVAGYAEMGCAQEALECFEEMRNKGFSPNPITFLGILKACGSQGSIKKGEQIHVLIVGANRGLLLKDAVLGTALVNMYVKCGAFPKARKVLQALPIRSTVSWNALIAGYAQQGQGHEALKSFEWMQSEGLSPNVVTFTCILKACGSMGAIEQGKRIHDLIANMDLLVKDILLGNTLVDMYAKCGALVKAKQVLEELPMRNTVSWNALITGYAQQGQIHEALECFEWMQNEGLSPNEATFSCVLCACTYLGLLDEAQVLFGDMKVKYGITPSFEHHTCMVMMLAFGGDFNKATSMIKCRKPSSDNLVIWLAVLSVCKRLGNVGLGKLVFDEIVQLDYNCAPAYILMADLFAVVGMQDGAKEIEAITSKHVNR